jgi:transcription elongation factor GreA
MTTQGQILVTEEEKKKIEDELRELIDVRRPLIAKKIGQAAADGDLSENGAYHDAKEQQGRLEGRIQELEHLARNAVVVEPRNDNSIGIGNSVRLKDERGNERTYKIVSEHGVSASNGLISDRAPLGAALVGHAAGDSVTYKTPSGEERTVTILDVD